MNFVFTTAMAHYPWAGSEELWGRAAMHLASDRQTVSALVPRFPELAHPLQELQRLGGEVVMRAAPLPKKKLLKRLLGRFGSISRTDLHMDLKWIREQKPSLVCVSNGNYYDGIFYMDFCAREKIPFVSIAQANAEWLWPDDAAADHIIEVYSRARASFFVSKANLKLAELQLGVPLDKAEVVRNPFKVSWNASPVWPEFCGIWRLACVARYDPSAKGQDILFEVLAMDKWRNRPLQISLFGAGPMERSLKRLVAMLNLEERVHFCGHVDDIEQIWSTHHGLVLASRYEGLPLALVEAMLCGRVSIVSDVSGNTELLQDGKTGFFAEAATVQHFDAALERAWACRENWRVIGEKACAAVKLQVPMDPAAEFASRLRDLAS